MSDHILHPRIALFNGCEGKLQEQSIVFIDSLDSSTDTSTILYKLGNIYRPTPVLMKLYLWTGTQWQKKPIEGKFSPRNFEHSPKLSLSAFKPRSLGLYFRDHSAIYRIHHADLAGKLTTVWGKKLLYNPGHWSTSSTPFLWKDVDPVVYTSLQEKQQISLIEANLME